jgi:phosphonate transport system permease protein
MAISKAESALAVETRIPAPAAGIASLILPGVGQFITGQIQRGMTILISWLSAWGILVWRIQELAFRQATVADKIAKAMRVETLFVVLALLFLAVLWLLSAWDAYKSVQNKRRAKSGVLLAIIGTFFVLGWQISEIDLVKMTKEAPEAVPPLLKVLWPWEKAVTYASDTRKASQEILVSKTPDDPQYDVPKAAESHEEDAYLEVAPRVGELSVQNDQGKRVPGTTLTVEGYNFRPNTETTIWWEDAIGNSFRLRKNDEYIAIQTDGKGHFSIDVIMPYRVTPPSSEGAQIHTVEARQSKQIGPPMPSEPLRLTIGRMIETIFMGMMATFFGILFAVPVSFLAARNIMRGSPITMLIYYITRTVMNVVRSIEPLIWALIAIVWVGLGPFAGIIALTFHSIAALGKLYSEAIEGIDHGPIEAIQATGANWIQTIVFGVIPQMISPFISFSIYRWDINVRMSTVIGLVGGGGIGFILVQYIRLLDYKSAGIAVWFIAVTVAILDYVSAEIRERMI